MNRRKFAQMGESLPWSDLLRRVLNEGPAQRANFFQLSALTWSWIRADWGLDGTRLLGIDDGTWRILCNNSQSSERIQNEQKTLIIALNKQLAERKLPPVRHIQMCFDFQPSAR